MKLPDKIKKVLLSKMTSKCNKLHVAITASQNCGYFVEFKFVNSNQSGPLSGDLAFKFSPDEGFVTTKSIEDYYKAIDARQNKQK